MTTVNYNSKNPRFPDVNSYHPVNDWSALVKALSDTPMLAFKVGNGAAGGKIDSSFTDHFNGAKKNNLISLGYWYGPWQVDTFLSHFPPADNCIPVLDFEQEHDANGKPIPPFLTKTVADPFIQALKDAWGFYPWFYGHSEWIAVGQPTGTLVEKCNYWGASYNSYLTIPNGVGKPYAHQFTDGKYGPTPHSFAGVSGNCDINSLLVPFSDIGGDNMTADDVAIAFGFSDAPSAAIRLAYARGLDDASRGVVKNPPVDAKQADRYNRGFDDYTKFVANGGTVPKHDHPFSGTTGSV